MISNETKKYWKNLASIPWSQRGEIRTKLVPWIFTNDHEFFSIIPQIERYVKAQKRNGNLRAAVLSGVGSILNIAPFTNVDFFVSVDRNSFVLDQVRHMIGTLSDADSPEEFIQASQLETLFFDLKSMNADPEPYWKMELESFAELHFLSSLENYRNTKKILSAVPVFYTQGNFTHPAYVKALGDALSGTTVSYASFTDLAEWSPEFLDTVNLLPFSDNSVIVWSTNKDRPDGSPLAQVSVGLESYIQDQSSLLNGLSVDYFKPNI